MTIERAAEILDPESKEKFYGRAENRKYLKRCGLQKWRWKKESRKPCIRFGRETLRRVRIAQAHGFCTTKMDGGTDFAESAARCLTGRTI